MGAHKYNPTAIAAKNGGTSSQKEATDIDKKTARKIILQRDRK